MQSSILNVRFGLTAVIPKHIPNGSFVRKADAQRALFDGCF